VLLVTPPLTISREDLDHGFAVLDDVLASTDLTG
jgi:4-aminobutyrate aminotransferase-like enzyme